jgi:polysaccharide biosynthesis protein PslF
MSHSLLIAYCSSLSKMHIALLTGEYPPQPGGVGDYTRRLGQALAHRGHQTFVFTIRDHRFQVIDLAEPSRNLPSAIFDQQSDWGWSVWKDVVAALDHTRPDVLHIQYQTGAYGMRPAINLLPWRLRRLQHRPAVVVTAHDLLLPYLFPKAGPVRGWITRRMLRDADAVVVTNVEDSDQVRCWRPPHGSQPPTPNSQPLMLIPIGSNIDVAPPAGYNRASWRDRLRVRENELLVAYFGLISRTKGLDTLLGALGRLPERFRLLAIGGAAMAPEDRAFANAIERQIADAGLARRVTITGHCSPSEVSAHMLAADLAALPYADGASLRRGSLLAALAHGLPTVTTRPATKDQRPKTKDRDLGRQDLSPSSLVVGPLKDGATVLLVPPSDEGALAAAIERLAHDRALRDRLADGGRALAAQFAWDEIAARHEALYAGLARD